MRSTTHDVKCSPSVQGRESAWEESCERIREEIAQIVDHLTPPACKVCTTLEVMLDLKERGFGLFPLQKVARHLFEMQKQGLVEGSNSGKLHLWSLTKEGRRWARTHAPGKAS